MKKLTTSAKNQHKSKKKTLEDEFQELSNRRSSKKRTGTRHVTETYSTSDEESTCTCPTCGLVYEEDNSSWICCDLCNSWFDLKCTEVQEGCIPKKFFCEDCC